jgi:hypothetical protein
MSLIPQQLHTQTDRASRGARSLAAPRSGTTSLSAALNTMTEPFFIPSDGLVCHVRTHHVEPANCKVDWRMDPDSKAEERDGLRVVPGELLMIGREPQVECVRDDYERGQLERLLSPNRRLRRKSLVAPPQTHVSASQLAIWFDQAKLMAASIGRNTVEVQRWGRSRALLARWPGEAIGQLATLWMPLTESSGGSNMRWRVSIAYTGPDELLRGDIEVCDQRPTGAVGGAAEHQIELTPLQRIVVVERFAQWLSFPVQTFDPKPITVAKSRPDEPRSPGQKPAKRRDSRMERLDGLLPRLERLGYSGRIEPGFVRALVEHGALVPGDVQGYAEIDMALLVELGLLPRARAEVAR